MCFEVVLQRLMDGDYKGPADVHAGGAKRGGRPPARLAALAPLCPHAAESGCLCAQPLAPRPRAAPPAADIQAVWAQAKATSPPGSDRALAAERLAPLVHSLWLYCGLEASPSPSPPPPQLQAQASFGAEAQQWAHAQQQMQAQAAQQAQHGLPELSSDFFNDDFFGVSGLSAPPPLPR